MDLQKFRETYKQVITESTNDSELKNFIRSIVEEVIKEMDSEEDEEMDSEEEDEEELDEESSAYKNFKTNVLPVFKKIPDNGTINQEFKDAVENHVKEYGEKQLANFMASEDGEMPKWYNTKSKTVKLGAPKFVPKEKFD